MTKKKHISLSILNASVLLHSSLLQKTDHTSIFLAPGLGVVRAGVDGVTVDAVVVTVVVTADVSDTEQHIRVGIRKQI